MTNAELLEWVRTEIAAHNPDNIGGGSDRPEPLDSIAVLRLISGELLRREWSASDRAMVARLADRADELAEAIARREGWYEERQDGLDQALRYWISQAGPRRFYWHGGDP